MHACVCKKCNCKKLQHRKWLFVWFLSSKSFTKNDAPHLPLYVVGSPLFDFDKWIFFFDVRKNWFEKKGKMNDESWQYVYRMMRKKFQWTAITLKNISIPIGIWANKFSSSLAYFKFVFDKVPHSQKCEIIFPNMFLCRWCGPWKNSLREWENLSQQKDVCQHFLGQQGNLLRGS